MSSIPSITELKRDVKKIQKSNKHIVSIVERLFDSASTKGYLRRIGKNDKSPHYLIGTNADYIEVIKNKTAILRIVRHRNIKNKSAVSHYSFDILRGVGLPIARQHRLVHHLLVVDPVLAHSYPSLNFSMKNPGFPSYAKRAMVFSCVNNIVGIHSVCCDMLNEICNYLFKLDKKGGGNSHG